MGIEETKMENYYSGFRVLVSLVRAVHGARMQKTGLRV